MALKQFPRCASRTGTPAVQIDRSWALPHRVDGAARWLLQSKGAYPNLRGLHRRPHRLLPFGVEAIYTYSYCISWGRIVHVIRRIGNPTEKECRAILAYNRSYAPRLCLAELHSVFCVSHRSHHPCNPLNPPIPLLPVSRVRDGFSVITRTNAQSISIRVA